MLVDRDGRPSRIPAEPDEYRSPRLSPDGRTVAVFGATGTESFVISTIDIQTGRRVSVPARDAALPTWDATGHALFFSAGLGLPQQILRWEASGNATPSVAFTTPFRSRPFWTLADGTVLLDGLASSLDVFVKEPQRDVRSILTGSRTESSPRVSPDGKWLAYTSNESGRLEIYVQPWPAVNRKIPVSVNGGNEPVWSRDGRELHFKHGRNMMVSRITTSPDFRATTPVVLFDAGRFSTDPLGGSSFDVTPDGRFVMIEDAPDARMELRVALHALAVRP